MSTRQFLPNFNKAYPGFRLLIIFIILASCITSHFVMAQTIETISTINFQILEDNNQKIHYAFTGDISKKGIIFIHGTPGNWSAFKTYLENKTLQKDFFMVSVDRLGWGLSTWKSSTDKDHEHFSFDSQAQSINKILSHYPNKKWIVVGHSLGASIAPKLALQQPSSVSGLLLLAGSLNPELGKPRWYNHIANNYFLKWLVPKKLRESNIEIMALQNELSILSEEIDQAQLQSRVVVIQGMRDKLVSPKNTQFVDLQWNKKFAGINVIELDDEGHFLPWRQTDLVIEQIKLLGL